MSFFSGDVLIVGVMVEGWVERSRFCFALPVFLHAALVSCDQVQLPWVAKPGIQAPFDSTETDVSGNFGTHSAGVRGENIA